MSGSDVTVEILKDIRDEIRGVRTELREEIHGVRTELGEEIRGVRTELGVVERALLDLAEQQRFVVRYTKAIAKRDVQLEGRESSLETRVDKLESK